MADDNEDLPDNLTETEGGDPEETSITSSENPPEAEAEPEPVVEPEPEVPPEPEPEPEAPPEPEPPKVLVVEREKSTASVKGEKSSASVKGEKSSGSVKGGKSSASVKREKSSASVKGEKSSASVKGEKSSASVKGDKSSKSVGKIPDPEADPEDESASAEDAAPETDPPPPTPSEPEPEPKPVIEVVPLGPLTEEAQKACEYIPFILDKMFHEGTSGRLNSLDPAAMKAGAGGIAKYEDYHWQLEKLFRAVPEDMAVAPGRYKPDELLYEGEKFVLGKLFRDIGEKVGYDPTAEKEESVLDLSDAIPVTIRTLPPEPCPRPYIMEVESSENEKCVQFQPSDQMRYGKSTNPNSGKIFEYSYAPIMAVDMDSECDGPPEPQDIPRPTTPHTCTLSQAKLLLENELAPNSQTCPSSGPSKANLPCQSCGSSKANFSCPSCGPSKANFSSKATLSSKANLPSKAILSSKANLPNNGNRGCDACAQEGVGSSGPNAKVCRNNLRCESNIQSVCQAARSAMAIYDTLTGCDNFPCNIGDRPEKELQNIEDGVWNWLYQVILKIIPKDSNDNPEAMAAAAILNTIQEETANDEEQCE